MNTKEDDIEPTNSVNAAHIAINMVFPVDVIRHIFSFGNSNQNRLVCTQWNRLILQNEETSLRKMYKLLMDQYPESLGVSEKHMMVITAMASKDFLIGDLSQHSIVDHLKCHYHVITGTRFHAELQSALELGIQSEIIMSRDGNRFELTDDGWLLMKHLKKRNKKDLVDAQSTNDARRISVNSVQCGDWVEVRNKKTLQWVAATVIIRGADWINVLYDGSMGIVETLHLEDAHRMRVLRSGISESQQRESQQMEDIITGIHDTTNGRYGKYNVDDWVEVQDKQTEQWIAAQVINRGVNWVMVNNETLDIFAEGHRLRDLGSGLMKSKKRVMLEREEKRLKKMIEGQQMRKWVSQHNRAIKKRRRRKSSNDCFVAEIKKHGWNLKVEDGDGNCLFRCFATEIYGNTNKHGLVRWRCCGYLRKNQAFFENFIPDFESRMKEKEQTREWGDHVDIIAFSELYNVRVRVYEYDDQMKTMIVRSDQGAYSEAMDLPIILLARHSQIHYNLIHDPKTPFQRPLMAAAVREQQARHNGITCVSLRQIRLIEDGATEQDMTGGQTASIEGIEGDGGKPTDFVESEPIHIQTKKIRNEVEQCRVMLEEKEKMLVEYLQRYWAQQEEMDKMDGDLSSKHKDAERLRVDNESLKKERCASAGGFYGMKPNNSKESAPILPGCQALQDEIEKYRAILEEKERMLAEQLRRYREQQEEMGKMLSELSTKRRAVARLKLVNKTLNM